MASTIDAVTQAYQNVLGRAPDQAGLDWWTNQVNSGAVSLNDLANQLNAGRRGVDTVQAPGAAASAQQMTNMAAPYTSATGAVAIPGVNDYAAKLRAAQQLSAINGQPVDSIMSTAFNNGVPVNSSAYTTGPGGTLVNTQDAVTQAYQNVLGRAPDQAGLDWWTKQVQSGLVPLSGLTSAIETGRRGIDLEPAKTTTPAPVNNPSGSQVTPPNYAPILPVQNVANYGIGLLPGETTYQSPIGTIAGGALFQAPQYSRPLPSGVDNYQSVTSAPRVTASIASLPKWVQNRIGMGPNFNAQPRNYKKGGLAQLAAGGQFSESDDLIQQQLDKLRKLEQNSTQLTAPQLAGDSMQLRADLLRRVQNSSAFQPTEEPSTAQQIGEAMLQAGSKGPAGIGQLIGRSGAEYFDAQKLRAADNQKRALAGLSLEERIIPDARLGVAGAGKGGAGPSPEQVRTVYQTSLNKNAQIAKEQGPWPSAEARNNWIRREAEKDVEMFLSRFAVNANVPRGEQLPEEGATESVTEPGAKPATSSTTTVFPRKPYPQSTSAPVVAPPARKLPEEARQKTFATGSEEMAMKDYSENIAPAAKVADSMLNVVNTIRQIPHTQDMFAPWREKVGAAFDAVGLDGKVVREAKNIKQIMPLLTKLANDRLLLAKGVQTEGDAQRAFNEFVKITDPKEAADFLYGWTKEIANRAKFKNELYRASKDQEGTWQKGEEYWSKSDYAQAPPMAVLNGKSWTFSDWRDKFLQANAKKGATIKDAISTWNNLTRGE